MRLHPRKALQAPGLDVMNFLNEVTHWYPEAISFAPGRPAERLFNVRGALASIEHFVHAGAPEHIQEEALFNRIGQYQKTNGIINELLCRFLENDEHISTTPEAIMVTDGCQEALTILLAGLFDRAEDVLLVIDPTYTGILGTATFLEVEVCPVAGDGDRVDLEALSHAVQAIRERGKRPRALYITPDYNNPLASCMSLEDRYRLLALAEEQELLLLEDNAYGMLSYDEGERLPTLKALDQTGVVIYIGTFSKLLFPALRLGFVVADQELILPGERTCLLATELSKVKSFTTVSTSALSQAIVGGILQEQGCSLKQLILPKVALYRTNRDTMLESLEQNFNQDPLLQGRVNWNRPGGGFFLTINLPFTFAKEEMQRCAEQYGVICCPMVFFSQLGGCEQQVRLSFSSVSPEEIRAGVARFWRFVHDRTEAGPIST